MFFGGTKLLCTIWRPTLPPTWVVKIEFAKGKKKRQTDRHPGAPFYDS